MSQDLTWLLLRGNNSFIVRRVRESPAFSKEPGNLKNLHSFKYSGLANEKTIGIADAGNGLTVTTRKSKASPHAVKSGKRVSTIRNRSSSRRASGQITRLAKAGYRPDLRTAALGRTSRLLQAQKTPRETPAKKVRGKKAAAASE